MRRFATIHSNSKPRSAGPSGRKETTVSGSDAMADGPRFGQTPVEGHHVELSSPGQWVALHLLERRGLFLICSNTSNWSVRALE